MYRVVRLARPTLAFAAPSRRAFSAAAQRASFAAASLRTTPLLAMQKRTMLRKISNPIKDWSVPSVQQTVLQLLFEYAEGVPIDRVNLDASIEHNLLVDKHDRFGLQWEICEIFQLHIDPARLHNRDFASGREVCEWVAANLEESGRLLV